MEIKVIVDKHRKNGDTMEFMVSDFYGGKYIISNCHRIESPFWKSHHVRCFIGNIDNGQLIKRGVFRIYNCNYGIVVI